MIEAAIVGALLAIGIILVLRGANPPDATLRERIEELTSPSLDEQRTVEPENFDELREQIAIRLLRLTKGDKIGQTLADAAAARTAIEAFAVEKLYAAIGGGLIILFLGYSVGLASTLIGGIVVMAAGAALGYNLPDLEVRRNAQKGRAEFEVALNAFVGLVSVSMSGGGGLNTAMNDAATVGRGWVFEMLQQTLSDAQLRGEPTHRALDRLGRSLQVDGLIEFAGALGLAGDSGARITETLIARADTGRKRMISDARSAAEKRSANLGLPIGSLLFGWVGFLGYPAVVNLVAGLS